MDRTSQSLRLHRTKSIVALLACVLALIPAPTLSQKAWAKDIMLRVVNNSKTPVAFSFCRMGDLVFPYVHSVRANPCYKASETQNIGANGDRKFFSANPIGATLTVNGKTVYFFVDNPTVGLPFFEINGNKVKMVEGELQTRSASGVTVRFHREGDTQYKVMTIEILSV